MLRGANANEVHGSSLKLKVEITTCTHQMKYCPFGEGCWRIS